MRKSKPKKRILLPDPKYHEVLVTQFVNNLMLQGKKSIAYSIFYDAIDMVGEKMKHHPSGGGKEPQGWWSELPSSDRGASGKKSLSRDKEYDSLLAQTFRSLHGGKVGRRNHGSL